MADADAAEAVGAAYMPVAPPLVLPDAAVPPPMAAETVVTLPPVAADAVEAAVAAMSAVLLPPPPVQMSQSVMGGGEEECLESEIHESQSVMSGGEECLEGEIHEAFESIEVLISSLADNQKPCDMMGYITERNECEQDIESLPVLLDIEGGESLEIPSISSSIDPKSYLKKLPEVTVPALGHLLEEEQPAMAISDNSKESEKQIPPPPPCPSEEQQKPKDDGDLSADSPTNSSDGSDQSDGEHHHHHYNIPIYSPYNYDPYRLMHRRERRNHWNDDYPFMYGFRDPWHPMTSLHIDDHWSRWPSPEPDQRKKRYNSGSCWSWPSPEPDCEKESYTVGAGLSNPRFWTCFLNCVLQCMVHTVPLVLKLRKADHPDPCPRVSIGFCCYCSLKQHVDESIRLSGSSFYPEIFVNCLKSISSDFKSGVQQDAQEFLRCLLDKLDEDSIAPRSSEESSSTEEGSVVKEIFRGCLKSQLRCPECNHCSDKSEPFLDLSLDLNMVETLMDALQSFTNTELIKDFMCDGCKSRVNMEKHFKIEQAPEVLVIHLKRFTNSESKIWDKVKYPLELDINSFMSSSDDTLQKYDLYGVVEHLGAYGSGHYVCYIRSSEADWYKFNDDKVNKCSVASALESTAYLLFYVKQGSSPWFSTLLEKEDKCPLAGSVSLEEQGEIALVNKEEEATSSHGQGNGNGPTLPDLSEQLQGNGNGNTLSVASDKLEEGCRLGETSAGTQGPSCLIGSGYKNGHADGCWEPSCKMKDVSPRGSQDRKEMKPIACGSLGVEVDHAVTQGGSPRKNENNCHLLQLSHKHKDNCDSLEVDHAVTQGGSPQMNENNCHLLQHPHERNDKFCHRSLSLQVDEIRGCCGVLSMGIGTSGSENERVESISNNELGDDNRGTTTKGGGEERRGRGGGESTKRKSADGGESKASRKRRKTKHCTLARHFALCRWSAVAGTLGKGGGEECSGRGGGESKKRKCADGGESKASRKRRKRKQSTVARHFALCRRWRAVASTGGKSKTRRR